MLVGVAGCAAPPEIRSGPPGPIVEQIRIQPGDVYDLDERPGLFYRLANAANVVVREEVVRREIEAVLGPGDPADPALIDEAERNLRALPFIAEATVVVTPSGEDRPDVYDVVVHTRDKFTLRVEASAGIFGGARKSRFSLGETDLFGFGKSLRLDYESNPDRDAMGMTYTDPQLLGSKHVLNAGWSDASDGYEHFVAIEKPFKTLASTWSYGASLRDQKGDASFFDEGERVARVPVRRGGATFDLARSFGTREVLYRGGARLSLRDDRYGRPRGERAAEVRVPRDGVVSSFGPTFRVDRVPRFGKRMRMDSINYVEDYPIGVLTDWFAGVQHRQVRGGSDGVEVLASGSVTGVVALGDDDLLAAQGFGRIRFCGEPVGWRTSSFVHYYHFGLSRQTVVASVAADAQWEREDLNLQLTLGEDNGLRGYPIRRFAGHRRVRFNLEDRIHTGLELLSVHTGLVAFFDAGMAWGRGESLTLSGVARSVGLGLRFGSAQLLGRNVVRVDLARPVGRDDGEALRWSVSVSVGQVVTLLGHDENLDDGVGSAF